jgi:WD40 repeat protein
MFQLSNSYSSDIEPCPDSHYQGTIITSAVTSSHIAVSTTDNLVHVISIEGKLLYSINNQNTTTGRVTAISIIDGGVTKSGHGLLILGYGATDGEIEIYGLESRYVVVLLIPDERCDIPSDKMRLLNKFLCLLLIQYFFCRTLQHRLKEAHPGSPAIKSLSLLKINEETRLVSTGYGGSIVIWDIETWTIWRLFEGHTKAPTAVTTLPGGQALVSGSWDGSIRIWQIDTGSQKAVLIPVDRAEKVISKGDRKYEESVSTMLVLPDGRIIAGGMSGYVRVWDSATW